MTSTFEKQVELARLMDRVRTLRKEIEEERQQRLQGRLRRLTSNQRAVLRELHYMGGVDSYCYTTDTIASNAGLDRLKAHRALCALRRLGFVALHRGLMNEDGQVCGSGYCITKSGDRWWHTVEEKRA